MLIREAHPGDEDTIAQIHVASWKTTYRGILPQQRLDHLSTEKRKQMWQQTLQEIAQGDRSKIVFVAVEEPEQVVGFIAGGKEREVTTHYELADAEIYAVYLLLEAQKRGIGRLLMQSIVTWMVQEKFRQMRLWVIDANPARKFYEVLGGKLLQDIKHREWDGYQYTEVRYGWDDLGRLQAQFMDSLNTQSSKHL